MIKGLGCAVFLTLVWSPAFGSMFDAGKHCVGYKFKKKSLSLFKSQVVAKNCDVSAQLLPVVGGGYQIEVSAPISAFESNDKDWDQDLRDILKESDQPDVIFHSKIMSEKDWKQLVQKAKVDLEGEITLANKTYPIVTPCTINKVTNGIEVDGQTTVPFSKFELQPPKSGGGFIAKADSDLEIHFHLMSEKVLGADKLFAPPEKDKDIIKDAMKSIDDDTDDSKTGDAKIEDVKSDNKKEKDIN
jgi:hypothetical protein